MPASISIVDSTVRASQLGRPNSLSHTPIPRPTGNATLMPMITIARVPMSGSRNPPVSLWEKPADGEVTNSSGRTNRTPCTIR